MQSLPGDDNIIETNNQQRPTPPASAPKKQYTLTVCMVPPPSATQTWAAVTRARAELNDPGLFRWPPHANILYPFVELKNDLEDVVAQLRNATKQCPPFLVSLHTFGTFGGKSRGVLWLYPKSYRQDGDDRGLNKSDEEPLIDLQALLQEQFPICTDQRKNGSYNPHMTLSHFASLDDAQMAQTKVESWWPNNVMFAVNEIYLLQRKGDDGQFLRVATLSLGKVDGDHSTISGSQIHNPPVAFPDMPNAEEDWVKAERMKLKERRNHSWKGKRRRRGRKGNASARRGPSTSADTPEVIAAKRAVRKEKRERLERERLGKESNDIDH